MAVQAHGGHSTEGHHGDLSEHAGDPHSGAHGDHPSVMLYIWVFVALMVALVAAIIVGVAIGGWTGTILSMAIGVFKAVLIIMYFMHVRYGTRLTWVFASASFLWLALLLGLTMSDYLSRPPTRHDADKSDARLANRADPLAVDRNDTKANRQGPIITTDPERGPIDRP